jgi:hypothetical protein
MAGFLFVVFHPHSLAFGRRTRVVDGDAACKTKNGFSWRGFLVWLIADASRKAPLALVPLFAPNPFFKD